MLCYSERPKFPQKNVLVYIPSKYNPQLDFNGDFKTCNLISGSERNCIFKCACEATYCKSVFIDLTDKDERAKVCEVTFSKA